MDQWTTRTVVGDDVVLQQGGIFVCQLYTVVKEGLVSLGNSCLNVLLDLTNGVGLLNRDVFDVSAQWRCKTQLAGADSQFTQHWKTFSPKSDSP